MRALLFTLLALPFSALAEEVLLTDIADDLYRVGSSGRYVLTRSCSVDGENLKAELSEKSVRFEKRSCEVVAHLTPWVMWALRVKKAGSSLTDSTPRSFSFFAEARI